MEHTGRRGTRRRRTVASGGRVHLRPRRTWHLRDHGRSLRHPRVRNGSAWVRRRFQLPWVPIMKRVLSWLFLHLAIEVREGGWGVMETAPPRDCPLTIRARGSRERTAPLPLWMGMASGGLHAHVRHGGTDAVSGGGRKRATRLKAPEPEAGERGRTRVPHLSFSFYQHPLRPLQR